MTIDSIAFKTRARTIDHLGREQIADCPTAISELWKNSYDAYAREVALHIFDGDPYIAALVDDGHGMSHDEFIEKWLVVGTESKAAGQGADAADRDGLPFRPRQGQKGIGRLSSAALGPLLLVVSKRKTNLYMAALIDWRLFENPYLFLQDIEIPVVEFAEKHELFSYLPSMFDTLMGNIWGNKNNPERTSRITEAWNRFDQQEAAEGKSLTREAIESVIVNTTFTERHLRHWPVWNGKSLKGTAMIVADIAFDLQAQFLSKSDVEEGSQLVEHAQERLFQTLSNFTDPFVDENEVNEFGVEYFKYSVVAWQGDLSRNIISDDHEFDYKNLESLEHVVDGEVDAEGIFKGRVKSFGKWLDGEIVIKPSAKIPTRVDTKIGPFELRIGTFEQLLPNTTHSEAVHERFLQQADKFAGFRVYRNGLRVMPYGREDNDFFNIEKRRSISAGREFWSYRRLFGRVALTRENNPNLRDKAGREGIIENRSAKTFRDIVINILRTSAYRYFGSNSEIRAQVLPELNANWEKNKAEEAEKQIRTRKSKEFRTKLKTNLPAIEEVQLQLEEIAEMARQSELPQSEKELLQLRSKVNELKTRKSELSLGKAPKSRGKLEAEYKRYRACEIRSQQLLVQLSDSIYAALEKVRPQTPHETAYSELNKNAAYLHHRLRKWGNESKGILAEETQRIAELIERRNKLYHELAQPLINDVENNRISLTKALKEFESIRERLDSENTEMFEPYISTLRSLQDSVNIESLVSFNMEASSDLKQEIERLNGLAQLGITVEVIGHEIESLEATVSRGFRELPDIAKKSPAYESAKIAYEGLVDRLRFLSPLKLSGEKIRVWISGQKIIDYVNAFFGDSLANKHIDLRASEAFLKFEVYEQPARIYPVFVNLINNSTYWVTQSSLPAKEILIDIVEGKVVISDNGPGVEVDDIKQLFSLFFTRKVRGGRGVGLYLCRANLAAGGHTISYATEAKFKKLQGANFVIDFRGTKDD